LSNEVKGQPKGPLPAPSAHADRHGMGMAGGCAGGPKHLELRLLIHSHCPIISVEGSEEDRCAALLRLRGRGHWRATVAVECNRRIVARGRHGAVQLRSAGTGAGEHGDDSGRCRLLLKDFVRYCENDKISRRLRDLADGFRTATIDCVVGGNNRVAERACGGRGRVSTGAAVEREATTLHGGVARRDSVDATIERDRRGTDTAIREWAKSRAVPAD
jgi:hypothetical protein